MKERCPSPYTGRGQLTIEAYREPTTKSSSSAPTTSGMSNQPTTSGLKVRQKGTRAVGTKGKAPRASSGKSTTRAMKYHKGGPFLDGFFDHLLSQAGGKRSEEAAKQVCRNISKYLYYLDKDSVCPDLLLKKTPIMEFVKEVESLCVGNSGILQKLDSIALALKYMSFNTEDDKVDQKISRSLRFIADIRKSFKVTKVREERKRLEDLASNIPDLSSVTTFLTSDDITKAFFDQTQSLLQSPEEVKRAEYNFAVAVMAGRLLYRLEMCCTCLVTCYIYVLFSDTGIHNVPLL